MNNFKDAHKAVGKETSNVLSTAGQQTTPGQGLPILGAVGWAILNPKAQGTGGLHPRLCRAAFLGEVQKMRTSSHALPRTQERRWKKYGQKVLLLTHNATREEGRSLTHLWSVLKTTRETIHFQLAQSMCQKKHPARILGSGIHSQTPSVRPHLPACTSSTFHPPSDKLRLTARCRELLSWPELTNDQSCSCPCRQDPKLCRTQTESWAVVNQQRLKPFHAHAGLPSRHRAALCFA